MRICDTCFMEMEIDRSSIDQSEVMEYPCYSCDKDFCEKAWSSAENLEERC